MTHKPHLACDADLDKIIYPIIGMPKIDGVRLMHLIGSATGRSLEPHANIYTTKRFSELIYQGIDGEAACGEPTSSSLCRDTTSALNTISGTPEIDWWAFDWLRHDAVDLMYAERLSRLETYIRMVNPPGIKLVPYTLIHNQDQLKAFYAWCLVEGYEGMILRDPKGLHKDGRSTAKSNGYLRLKPSSDKEALVLRLEEAMQNNNEAKTNKLGRTERSTHKENLVGKRMVGTIIGFADGQEIRISPGKMTHAERIDFWLHPEKIVGQQVKFRSLDVGVKDAPRFARYLSIRAKSDMS